MPWPGNLPKNYIEQSFNIIGEGRSPAFTWSSSIPASAGTLCVPGSSACDYAGIYVSGIIL